MSVNPEKIAKAVALTQVSGIADGRAKELITELGSPSAVHNASYEKFEKFYYVDEETYDEIKSLQPVINELENRFAECIDRGIHLIPIFDTRYPKRLKSVSGPLLLYAQGDVQLLSRKNSIGFTGTREAEKSAKEWTKETAQTLASNGHVVISGGARGVDSAAHRGALNAGGDTIVVLGTGIDVPYPEANEELFDVVVDQEGLVLSQRKPNAGPSRVGFLNRNQTLTGLSKSVIVVATDGEGGTMSTYENAKQQERSIFCPNPNKVDHSDGIKQILDESEAIEVDTAEDILNHNDDQKSLQSFSERSSEER